MRSLLSCWKAATAESQGPRSIGPELLSSFSSSRRYSNLPSFITCLCCPASDQIWYQIGRAIHVVRVIPWSIHLRSNSRSESASADIADVWDRPRASSEVDRHTSGGTQVLDHIWIPRPRPAVANA